MKKQKLELTWIGKDERPKLEPRILLEDAEKSYHAKARVGERDIFDNRLVFGDNLLALKALESEVKMQHPVGYLLDTNIFNGIVKDTIAIGSRVAFTYSPLSASPVISGA